MTRIAIDAMGGDFGPTVTIPGAALALERIPELTFIFFGKQAEIDPVLKTHPKLAEKSSVVHCEIAVRMDDKPSQALRLRRQYRRADGDVTFLPSHHGRDRAPGNRRDLADFAR